MTCHQLEEMERHAAQRRETISKLREEIKYLQEHLRWITKEYQSQKIRLGFLEGRECLLDARIDELDWSVRASNCLRMANIFTIRQLAMRSKREFARLKNVGIKTTKEVEEMLQSMGLRFGMTADELESISNTPTK